MTAGLRHRVVEPSPCSPVRAPGASPTSCPATPGVVRHHVRRVPPRHGHPKVALALDAILVVSPEHGRVFREAGWSQGPAARRDHGARSRSRVPSWSAARAASTRASRPRSSPSTLPKFRDGGLLIVHAGGGAGLFSAVIGGWASGADRQRARDEGGRQHDRNPGLLDPTGERQAPARGRGRPGRRSLVGRTVGLLDITQAPRGRVPRPAGAAARRPRVRASSASRSRRSRRSAPIDLRHEISEQCDVVIEALAD